MGKIPGALMYGADDRTKAKWVVAKSLGVWSHFWVYSQDPGQQISLLGTACFLKMAFLFLGLHEGFIISYRDPTAPTSHFYMWMDAKLLLLRGI